MSFRCEWCGAETTGRKLHCSDKCRMAAWRADRMPLGDLFNRMKRHEQASVGLPNGKNSAAGRWRRRPTTLRMIRPARAMCRQRRHCAADCAPPTRRAGRLLKRSVSCQKENMSPLRRIDVMVVTSRRVPRGSARCPARFAIQDGNAHYEDEQPSNHWQPDLHDHLEEVHRKLRQCLIRHFPGNLRPAPSPGRFAPV